ncbi:iron complex transport system permease protein [Abditibacterium utsteinense]|uniref:Iron complex transport system permease protein n=1 Tax=Abditibacterium utsteinense TaxID=1960156 RepID=A0A2S8SUY1_9BACT|nr:iron ABC transporter permease [Abditibacterium utsteinense]PQV64600.1 iron complex transport system permease protein [Abditibacterium utsteinense]
MFLRRHLFWPLLFLCFGAAILLSLTWGAPVAFSDLWSDNHAARDVARQIFGELRPPRVVAALLVGASLSVAGAGLQSLFRNPLAEPYLLGISAGGALGATLAAALRLPGWNGFDAGALLAFGGALLASSAVYALGKGGGANSSLSSDRSRLLLCGVALSAFLSALMSLVIALSGRLDLAQQITFWLLGGLTRASWPQNLVLLFAFIVGGAILLGCARDLNALRAGEEDAASLGVEIGRVHRKILLAASLLSAACVAAAGLIGFIGLLAPHLVRLLGGRDARVLLPGAALMGATLLCLCDALARGLFPPLEVPVGILTALLGVPLFLFLARKS